MAFERRIADVVIQKRVFAKADAALYEAKRKGRDRVCLAPAQAAIGAPALA